MIGRRWRSPILVAAVLAVGSVCVPAPPPAAAGSNGACQGTTGVTVVVDFQALGGGVVVRCAPGSPATGFKALTAAGFSITQVQNVPGFLCRIDGRPGPERDPCINAPPASAYWSYWHAARGGTWASSSEGANTRTPPPGSVEGWSFSDDGSPGAASPPGIDPPAASATPKPATPRPATPRPATPRPATPAPVPATPKPATPAPVSTPKPVPTADPTARPTDPPVTPGDAPTPSPTPTPTPTAAALVEVSPTPTADPTIVADAETASDASPPIGTLLGIGLIVLMALAALVVRARRQTDPGGGDG